MNMKQKLTYMLIGCLFTLAGTVISNLTNTPTQAQDEKVIDEIVCKKLKIVNDEGITMSVLGSSLGRGRLGMYNEVGKPRVYIGTSIFGGGYMQMVNAAGMPLVSIVSLSNGGSISIDNAAGMPLVSIGTSVGNKAGSLSINNETGKTLINIGGQAGHPNDGIINIYNHKGEWRSFSAD